MATGATNERLSSRCRPAESILYQEEADALAASGTPRLTIRAAATTLSVSANTHSAGRATSSLTSVCRDGDFRSSVDRTKQAPGKNGLLPTPLFSD